MKLILTDGRPIHKQALGVLPAIAFFVILAMVCVCAVGVMWLFGAFVVAAITLFIILIYSGRIIKYCYSGDYDKMIWKGI